mmetsp:Transcript_87387/g.187418  ORF Transcript_87387/g.187418 Transcript_87387/m.187418 type:complete len:277 (+) Transcript_87387:304-1134(+)
MAGEQGSVVLLFQLRLLLVIPLLVKLHSLELLIMRSVERIRVEDVPAESIGVPFLFFRLAQLHRLDGVHEVVLALGQHPLLCALLAFGLLLAPLRLPLPLLTSLLPRIVGIRFPLLLLYDLLAVRGAACIHFQPQLEEAPLPLVARRAGGAALLALSCLRSCSAAFGGILRDGSAALLTSEDRLRFLSLIRYGHGVHLLGEIGYRLAHSSVRVRPVAGLPVHLTATDDDNRDTWLLITVCGHLGNRPHHVHAFNHLSEGDVPPIEHRSPLQGDEEL